MVPLIKVPASRFHLHPLASGILAAWLTLLSTVLAQEPAIPLVLPRSALIHLDAGSIELDAAANQSTPPTVTRWKNSSNQHSDSSQRSDSNQHSDFVAPNANCAPLLIRSPEGTTLRFDGQDDVLRMESPLKSLSGGSIWIVVAPHNNPGDFRGILATNAPNQRDYMSGLNVDLGPGPSLRWDMINIEGKGFSGARNMSSNSVPFGNLAILSIQLDPAAHEIKLQVDGKDAGSRPWESKEISIDQWTLGARFYTNGPTEQQVRGNLACDIAELIVFDGVLSNEEQRNLHDQLQKKYAKLKESLPRSLKGSLASEPLIKHADAPAVQMLFDGFEVHRLPVEITNVNNVAYRADGKLVTLGYNGDIHLLSDTDGDQLEDQAHVFYKNNGSLRGPIGMQFLKHDDPRGWGVFVASKGKVSLLLDRDRDERCDEEIIVAQGWDEIVQNVDAVGLATDANGALYFGLGTANYANAYLVDDQGNSKYDIKSDRGTIQKISPDFSKRETICTGVRFPIGIAFHPNGDLFCTDQEGATWLPNGNPFDELLHIEPNQHYGFPPRHPNYNPSVLDQPSVFDYGPQHQSTCGLFFNPSADSPNHFGPTSWADNAIVCGESRGKLWRTQLVKTPHGYTAQTQLIAALQELTIDACVSPQADLVVACHSGPPDWGTGPAGIGNLYKIRTAKHPVPRPVLSWRSSPNAINIAFDHPIDPTRWSDLSKQILIDAGPFVRAADRYENLVPPYAVVQGQMIAPRQQLPITSVGLSPDLRTLSINFKQSDSADFIAVTLPSNHSSESRTIGSDDTLIPQRAETQIDASANGVLVHWDREPLNLNSDSSATSSIHDPTSAALNADSTEQGDWIGWIPHLDLSVSRALTQGSAEHDRLWESLNGAGRLILITSLDMRDIYRPKLQPGTKLDYTWPEERTRLQLRADGAAVSDALLLNSADHPHKAAATEQSNPWGWRKVQDHIAFDSVNGTGPLVAMTWTLTKQQGELNTSVAVATDEAPQWRAMPLVRFIQPWVKLQAQTDELETLTAKAPELEGGNWGLGRKLFFSQTVGCSKCHTEPGSGAEPIIGPDLSNLPFRDYASNLRDIQYPSHAINPEFIGHQVRLNDGTVLTGVLRDRGLKYLLGDSEGKQIEVLKTNIEEMKPSKLSIMPTGLIDKLTSEQVRDLMTYLMSPAPSMPLSGPTAAPAMRTEAQVAKVLEGSVALPSELKELNIVLVAGPKDHGPSEHDYPAWLLQWGQLLTAAENVNVEAAWEFPDDTQMDKADVLVFFQKGSWDPKRQESMDKYFARGGGAIYLHWAVNGSDQVGEFSKRIGLASWGGKIKYRHGPLQLRNCDPSHPIMRNVPELDLLDESYWLLTGDVSGIGLLATSQEDGEATPQLWTYEKNKGRVFVSIPGHYSWTFDDPIFRIVLLRSFAWVANEPIDRFNALVPLGARIKK